MLTAQNVGQTINAKFSWLDDQAATPFRGLAFAGNLGNGAHVSCWWRCCRAAR